MNTNPSVREQEVLTLWKQKDVFKKVQDARRKSKPFVMYEGPPTANGSPGIHHVLTRTFKDTIARYQTMLGRFVERKAGWDNHGLPVELEVQKQLKLSGSADVVAYGVNKFNIACEISTQKFIGEWEKLTERMGYWLDFQNAYRTSDPEYIEKVWTVLEALYEAGHIYQGHKIVPWACDSQTVLSNAELDQGRREVEHLSCTVKFRLADNTDTYLLAWTTTPWTLPANMGLAVNPNFTYYESIVQNGVGEAPHRLISLHKADFLSEAIPISGKKLVGLKYEHPYTKKHNVVYGADWVTVGTGTGIVHIAPGYGQEDFELWQQQMSGEEIIQHVADDGSFNEKAPAFLQGGNVLTKDFAEANMKVVKDLHERKLNYKTAKVSHVYPHNWRTGLPLIYTLRKSWFVRTTDLELKQANQDVKWVPSHVKDGRFGEWLAEGRDWAISRERFWGTPLPFYSSGNSVSVVHPHHPHKPHADEPMYPKGEVWTRTPEVLDCWFDSGAVPFAGYSEYQRADVVCEGMDQTRGWFYTLMIIGVGLRDESPYKAAVCLGHVLDKDGVKMSKSKGNTVDPWQVFDREGADAVRWYMLKNPVGNPLLWNESEVRGVNKGFFNRLLNCVNFLETASMAEPRMNVLYDSTDKWIIARLWETITAVSQHLTAYTFNRACEALELFVDDLSNVWLRSNRDRFLTNEINVVRGILLHCLSTTCRLLAPMCPMLAEHVWYRLGSAKQSVHMADWPTGPAHIQPSDVLLQMKTARQVVTEGLRLRAANNVRIRQPLSSAIIPKSLGLKTDFYPYVTKELNVKSVQLVDYDVIGLDFNIDEDLEAEGLLRDLTRAVQDERKKLGLKRGEPVAITLDVTDAVKQRLKSNLDSFFAAVYCVKVMYEKMTDGVKVSDIVFRLTKEME